MKLFNLSNPQDFMALLVRRKLWILIPFLALSCAALLMTYMLPRMYVSKALVLIQPRDVPDEIIKDALAGSADQRLAAIKEMVLSRASLIEILREFDDRQPELQKMNVDQKVETLRSQIDFEVDQGLANARGTVPFFRISYRSRDPETAQKIAARLTEVFIEKDNQARETKVDNATSFLSGELQKIKIDMDASNTKLKNLKALRRDSLPDQTPTNLSTLGRLEQRRSDDSSQLRLAQTRLTYLEQLINTPPKEIPSSKPVQVVVSPLVERNPLVDDYLATQVHLKGLKSRGLTDNHPEVRIDTNTLESLEKQIPPDVLREALAPKPLKPITMSPAAEMVPNPLYLSYTAEKATVEKSIEDLRKAVSETEEKIKTYDARIQDAPQSEQELQDVLRENIELNKRYQEMSDSLNRAQISQSLESRQQSSPLRIADPANYPLSPTKPAKPVVAGVGVLLSLLFGIAFAVFVDVANQKMWTLSDVESLLGATVLVEIPEIVTAADLNEGCRKRKIFAASFALLSAAYGAGLYVVYRHQGFVLSHLEPVIRRLY